MQAPQLWNNFPREVCLAPSLSVFWKQLKGCSLIDLAFVTGSYNQFFFNSDFYRFYNCCFYCVFNTFYIVNSSEFLGGERRLISV